MTGKTELLAGIVVAGLVYAVAQGAEQSTEEPEFSAHQVEMVEVSDDSKGSTVGVDPIYAKIPPNRRGIRLKKPLSEAQKQRFREWITDTVKQTEETGKCALIASKNERRLQLYCDGQPQYNFHTELGGNPLADKIREGDNATPEGRYRISRVKDVGETDYYRAFLINYPKRQDRKETRESIEKGEIPQDSTPGGAIEIHGQGGRGYDWTLGCLAVEDSEIDVLFQFVRDGRIGVGTPVTIVKADPGKS